jgi:hypothetical protein
MIRVLRSRGWQVPDKRIVISSKKPATDPCLINVKWTGLSCRHWIILWDKEIYCSLGYDKYFYKVAEEAGKVKLVSFLPLTPPRS